MVDGPLNRIIYLMNGFVIDGILLSQLLGNLLNRKDK